MGRTLAEKILLAHTDADELAPGDFVMVRCDVVMANDLGGPHAARELVKMGVDRVFDPEQGRDRRRPPDAGEGHPRRPSC